MTNYPRLWFANIIALLEKRAYHTYNVLLFALFVAAVRLFTEWSVGGAYPGQLLSAYLISAGFYWLAFFAVTTVLSLTVEQPWRRSINVILVGIFLGILPPFIDVAAGGKGFVYGYVWRFPEQWRWVIYNADQKITPGEGTVLWVTTLLTTAYVWHKTRSAARTALGFMLGYGAVVLILSLVATAAHAIVEGFDWPIDHRVAVMGLLQFLTAFLLYLFLQRRVLARLGAQLPFIAASLSLYLTGAALAGPLGSAAAVYGLALLVALAGEEANALPPAAGSAPDEEDRRFFNITNAFMLACLGAAHSVAVMPLLVVLIVAVRGAAPLTQATRRAATALASLALGIVASMEQAAYGAPKWWIRFVPRPAAPEALQVFDAGALAWLAAVAVAFIFFAAAERRRERAPALTAGIVAGVAVALPMLLAASGRVGWMYPPLGIVAGSTVWMLRGRDAFRYGGRALAAASALYLLVLAFALRNPLT